jgi:ribonuclease R
MGNRLFKRQTDKAKEKVIILKKKIFDLLKEYPSRAFSEKQIIRKLNIKQKHLRNNVDSIMLALLRAEKIRMTEDGRFSISKSGNEISGKVDYVNAKYAFIVSDDIEEDVLVRTEDLKTALDDDLVKVRVFSVRKDGRPIGAVTEIVKRYRMEFVGRIEVHNNYAFVIPDFKKMHHDIFIRVEGIKKAENNDKVIVRIIDWKEGDKNPLGEVIKILGPAGNNDAEIHSIMAEFGLPFEFKENIMVQAKKIDGIISKDEITRRRDFRGVTTFTIDPEDAKDFDDAISLKELNNGNYELGVHIADVTFYVYSGTEIDKEAYQRATSVYLVDRTIPMLPERLSNELCSLRPKEDKLTFSAVFELDKNANLKSQWFGRTIIHSDRRFTYEEAQERLESCKGDFSKELNILNDLAKKLRAERYRHGSINFETTEVRFELSDDGKPIAIVPKQRKDAHKLIEEFMLMANKKVAEHVYNLNGSKGRQTFVYRIHDEPDMEKLQVFASFAKKFGHLLDFNQESIAKALNKMMDEIEGKPEQNVLENLAIRSMAKAKYSINHKGHFGLSFPHYTHFTSPIRRYPDMMVHRLLSHYLSGGKSVATEEYEKSCLHSSEREKVASDAERASIKYKQVEFMMTKIGEEFEGLIGGLTEWGIYIEIITTKVEGMIRMSALLDDYYEFDEKNMRVVGRYSKRIYTLGDHVKVKVLKADVDRRTIDLAFSENE